MGYIAYAAGALIAAAVIHSFVTKKTHRESQNSGALITIPEKQPEQVISDSEDEEEIEPVVTIEISHDEDQQTQPKATKDAEATRGTSIGTSTPSSIEDKSVTPQEPVANGHVPKPPSGLMAPPPPRSASSPNLAAQARKTTSMPPPSSLPPSRARSPPRLKPATVSSLAPTLRGTPGAQSNSNGTALRPPPSSASSLRVPAQKVLANTHMQPQSSLAPTTSTLPAPSRPSRKVILSPGHSPLDWATLTKSTSPSAPLTLRGSDASDMLGPYRLGRITPSQLKQQNGRKGKDAWTVYQGRVYNISAYLDFHPGGREELLKGAGRKSDGLFAEVHPWVNWEGMLSGCCVGILVAEGEGDEQEKGENELDEMD